MHIKILSFKNHTYIDILFITVETAKFIFKKEHIKRYTNLLRIIGL